MSTKEIEIACEIKHQTDQAYLIYDGNVERWVPKSIVSDYCEEKDVITSIFIPEWFALDNGLI